MKLEYEILVNQYGQDLFFKEDILNLFESFDINDKQTFFINILDLIMQSKPQETDVQFAIDMSCLKPTHTPCVLLRKIGINHNLKKLIELPENEWKKSLTLLLSLFKIAYRRRFEEEANDPNKWWYWNLSDDSIIRAIKNMESKDLFS